MLFFFQAEDGIRDRNVTGVQTCALPILVRRAARTLKRAWATPPVNGQGLTQLRLRLTRRALTRPPRRSVRRPGPSSMPDASWSALAEHATGHDAYLFRSIGLPGGNSPPANDSPWQAERDHPPAGALAARDAITMARARPGCGHARAAAARALKIITTRPAIAHHLPGVSTQKPHVRHIISTYSLIEPVT